MVSWGKRLGYSLVSFMVAGVVCAGVVLADGVMEARGESVRGGDLALCSGMGGICPAGVVGERGAPGAVLGVLDCGEFDWAAADDCGVLVGLCAGSGRSSCAVARAGTLAADLSGGSDFGAGGAGLSFAVAAGASGLKGHKRVHDQLLAGGVAGFWGRSESRKSRHPPMTMEESATLKSGQG